jgi:hypothetical protein
VFFCDGSVERDSFYESHCSKQQLIKTNITFLSPKQNFAHEKIIFFLNLFLERKITFLLNSVVFCKASQHGYIQGTLTEGEGSLQLTS